MGGELVWTPARTHSDDEHEESWATLNTAGSEDEPEDPNNCWYYRPSNFHHWFKGLAVRAGIRVQYLESIQHQVDERKSSRSGAGVDSASGVAGSRRFLSEAGILAATDSSARRRVLDDGSESGYPEPAFVSLTRKLNVPPGTSTGLPLESLRT